MLLKSLDKFVSQQMKLRVFRASTSVGAFLILKVKFMENELYKKMYYHLFNAVTDAIRTETKQVADEILKQAQIETEEIYINGK